MPNSAVLDNSAEAAVQRESIRLAFIAALQHLPAAPARGADPARRAAVEGRGVAQLIGSTGTSVNSALQRARADGAETDGGRVTGINSFLDAPRSSRCSACRRSSNRTPRAADQAAQVRAHGAGRTSGLSQCHCSAITPSQSGQPTRKPAVSRAGSAASTPQSEHVHQPVVFVVSMLRRVNHTPVIHRVDTPRVDVGRVRTRPGGPGERQRRSGPAWPGAGTSRMARSFSGGGPAATARWGVSTWTSSPC